MRCLLSFLSSFALLNSHSVVTGSSFVSFGAFIHHYDKCTKSRFIATTELSSSLADSEKLSPKLNPNWVDGPSKDTKPDYENIHGPMGKFVDDIFLSVFRTKLSENVGIDSNRDKKDYMGVVELASALNARFSNHEEIQTRAQNVLRQLFPSWLPGPYTILFSKPFPEFSSRMNAWATKWGATWLMGECEIVDIDLRNPTTTEFIEKRNKAKQRDNINGGVDQDQVMADIGENQGLLVKRCRFLEESQCASVCVNSCKIPTQNFLMEDMGVPLTMTPNYETYECIFEFGKLPTEENLLEAMNTPCLSRCPSNGSLRKSHSNSNPPADRNIDDDTNVQITVSPSSRCKYMGDD